MSSCDTKDPNEMGLAALQTCFHASGNSFLLGVATQVRLDSRHVVAAETLSSTGSNGKTRAMHTSVHMPCI